MTKRRETSNEENNEPKKPRRARRIKGTGSVYPRSDGRWGADFIVEETGKKKTLYGRTAQEAQAKLDKALQEQRQGILATGPQQKLADHLEWWLEEALKGKLRTSTYIRYRGMLDNHILPELGQIQLRKLTTKHLQAFYNKLRQKLALATVHKTRVLLGSGLRNAVKSHAIPFNPNDGTELPAIETEEEEGQSLTLEQAKLLLETVRGHRLEAFIALALTTGMRLGEMLALRWDDLNFETETISVHRTVGYHAHYHFIEGAPKTKKSKRDVPLLPFVRDILEAHRVRQNDVKGSVVGIRDEKRVNVWQEKNLVFASNVGGFWDPASTRATFYRLLDKAGLPRIRIHDLRHTASTLWESLGISEKIKQEWLGHTSLKMTRIKYTHVLPSMQKEAADKVNRLFQGPDSRE